MPPTTQSSDRGSAIWRIRRRSRRSFWRATAEFGLVGEEGGGSWSAYIEWTWFVDYLSTVICAVAAMKSTAECGIGGVRRGWYVGVMLIV